MKKDKASAQQGEYHYQAFVTGTRSVSDYTGIITDYNRIAVPLGNNLVLWQC